MKNYLPKLTEKEIKYGFFYFHKDEAQPRKIIEVSEYQGETALGINCTQLSEYDAPQYKTVKEKNRVLQEWCDFLKENPTMFEELLFYSRVPQQLFDAICEQKKLKKLYIKWGVYPDISKIENLQELKYLHIGSGAGVESIQSIATLKKLIALSVENFQKISDYSSFSKLKNLECLYIQGDGLSPKYIHVDSLDFLKDMKQLRFFYFLTAILKSKDMTPVLSLTNIENLTLSIKKETKEIYEQLRTLPKLKFGLIVEKPELYR